MNYIKLKIGGKERGAKLGLLFLENAQKSEDKNIQELFSELQKRTLFFAPKLIYYSLLTNCQINGDTQDFSLGDVYDWVEEEGISSKDSSVVLFINAFGDSITKLFKSENVEDLGKSKPAKKDLTPIVGNKK